MRAIIGIITSCFLIYSFFKSFLLIKKTSNEIKKQILMVAFLVCSFAIRSFFVSRFPNEILQYTIGISTCWWIGIGLLFIAKRFALDKTR